ncbi:MAG: YbdK family carboxylate-amine ligase [Candidatus Berkiella sp.]
MTNLLAFKGSAFPTIGVELELQLINLFNFNLAIEASDFLRRLADNPHRCEFKPEITQAMIEINTSVHYEYEGLLQELVQAKNYIAEEALKTHIGICGGGTHPFQKWKNQRIYITERFTNVSNEYGFLAKQFTVFGQHIHVGCPSGDDALYLCHALAKYIPHFIALSAASPFQQGVDTSFDCSRLAIVSAFPLSGTPPWVFEWHDFEKYFDTLYNLGVVKSMKDFYWDIRPKPEFSTIELRIGDTPLTIQKAAELGAYAQMLVAWLLDTRPQIHKEIYYTYLINRFRAARYGYNAVIIDPINNTTTNLHDELLKTFEEIAPYAATYKSSIALERLKAATENRINGAHWLREQYKKVMTLEDMVRKQSELWMEKSEPELLNLLL